MEISDVRVKLINDTAGRLKAVCTVTFDNEFVVRDVKVVAGTNGLFVAMPSRKMSSHCPKCRQKNNLRAKFCNECGVSLPPLEEDDEENGRARLHRDIAHPITSSFRDRLHTRVLRAYENESEAAGDPDYQPHDTEEDAPDAPDAPEEVGEESSTMSEYDSIIAGLRSGGPTPPERDQAGSGRGRGGGPGRRDDGDRGRGSRRGGERGGGARGRRDERAAPRRDDGRGARRDESRGGSERSGERGRDVRGPAQVGESRERARRGVEHGANAADRRPVEHADKPVTKPVEKPASEPAPVSSRPPSPPVDDEDLGFGEGIL